MNLTTDYSDTDTGIGIAANTWHLKKYLQSSKCNDTYSATRTCGNQLIFFIAVCDPTWGICHLCMHLGLMCSKIQAFRLPAKQKSRRLCSHNHCSGYCQNNEIKFPMIFSPLPELPLFSTFPNNRKIRKTSL